MAFKRTYFIGCSLVVMLLIIALVVINTPIINSQKKTDNKIIALLSVLSENDNSKLILLLDDDYDLLTLLKENTLNHYRENDLTEKNDLNFFTHHAELIGAFNQLKFFQTTHTAHSQLDSFFSDVTELTDHASEIVDVYKSSKLNDNQSIVSLPEEVLVANANLFLALNQMSEGGSTQAKKRLLSEWYSDEQQRQSSHRVLEVSLLHSLWLVQSNHFIANREVVFLQIKDELNNEADLVRLLNNKTDSVVTVAAGLIGLLAIDNALTGLRFQLTQTKNEQVLFALLDALSVYAKQSNQFEPQLRKMQRLTQSSDLRQKIQQTIDRLHGRSV